MMRKPVLIALATLMLAGACTEREKRVRFDGIYYPTRQKTVDKTDRRAFTVTVRRTSRGLDGAREAGRLGGSKYCIKNFGTSEIEWANGPDAPAENLQYAGGNLVLSGRCITW